MLSQQKIFKFGVSEMPSAALDGKLCYHAINISGRSRGGDQDPPPPYLSTKMRPEGQKTFFGGDPSPPNLI